MDGDGTHSLAIFSYKNFGGKQVFRELSLYKLRLLTLPSSNAIVERGFSIMNSIKNKIRNRMLLILLDSLLRIRLHFLANKMCWKQTNFQQTNCLAGGII